MKKIWLLKSLIIMIIKLLPWKVLNKILIKRYNVILSTTYNFIKNDWNLTDEKYSTLKKNYNSIVIK